MRRRWIIPVVLCMGILAAGCGSRNVDSQRAATLRRDPLGVAQAPGTTPQFTHSNAGSGDGIGFGGVSPTVVEVIRHLQGDRPVVTRYYAAVAIQAGWQINSIRCSTQSDSFAGSKQEPGWVASVVVGVGKVFGDTQAVSIVFETDWHGSVTPGTLGVDPVTPLTVATLGGTCLSAPA